MLFILTSASAQFDDVGGGTNGIGVQCLHADTIDGTIILGGAFNELGNTGVQAVGIGLWDGSQFSALGCGIHGGSWDCVSPIGTGWAVRTISKWNGDYYAAGWFTHSGMQPVNNIARWDGTAWQPLLGGVDGPVYSLKSYPDGLYVAGWFDYADTVLANGLARWDGSQWHDVHNKPRITDPGSATGVNDVVKYQGHVYVGGNFSDSSGGNMRDIAMWDGTSWGPVGNGLVGSFSTVNKLRVHDGLLYVAGSFGQYGPFGNPINPGNGIVTWDGSNWNDLGGGTFGASNASVLDMHWNNDTMYVIGHFNRIGGIPVERFALWDGQHWCALAQPGTFDLSAVAMAILNDTIYLGGSFQTINGDSIRRLASWYGGMPDSCGVIDVGVQQIRPSGLHTLVLAPNPAGDQLLVHGLAHLHEPMVVIYDAVGKVVLHEPLPTERPVDVSRLEPGSYLVRVMEAGMPHGTGRFIKL